MSSLNDPMSLLRRVLGQSAMPQGPLALAGNEEAGEKTPDNEAAEIAIPADIQARAGQAPALERPDAGASVPNTGDFMNQEAQALLPDSKRQEIGTIAGPGVVGDKTGTQPSGMYAEAYQLRQRADDALQKMGYGRKDIDAALLGGKALPPQAGSPTAPPAASDPTSVMRKVLSIKGPGYAADGSGRRVVPDLSDYERFSPYSLSPEMRQARMAEIGQQKQSDTAEKLKGMETGSAEKVAGIHGQSAENVARINQGGKEQLIRQIIGAQVASGQPLDPSKLKDIMDLESAAQKDFAEQRAPTPKTAAPGVPGQVAPAPAPAQAPKSALEGLEEKFDTTSGTYKAMEDAIGQNEARNLDAMTQKAGEGGKMSPVSVSDFISTLAKNKPGLIESNPQAIGNWLEKKYGRQAVDDALGPNFGGRMLSVISRGLAGGLSNIPGFKNVVGPDPNVPFSEQVRANIGNSRPEDRARAAIRQILKSK